MTYGGPSASFVINNPWNFLFSHDTFIGRSQLAAIDHNHHLNLQPATNKDGTVRYTRRFGKRRRGWKLVASKEKKNFSYIPTLTARVLHQREVDLSNIKKVGEKADNHPEKLAPNIGNIAAPSTEELRQQHATRF